MPMSHDNPTLDALRRLAVTTLAYALGVGLVAVALPHLLTPMPVAALLPEPLPVVARVPVAPPPTEPAP
ncbi:MULTISPECIES: hypothetical protein [unclassified Phenylobacterium]|uniref:hypothetical protein n=1 Tax=unclassified Phenylobacterium TaxID=2640670 RepID=UPI00083A2327|nr:MULTISPECIES: hypothetical protein [unclassified Phenylobacterium]